MATARKFLDVTDAEIDKLGARIVDAVKEPKDPRALKEILGGAVRNLGEAGKKRGMTTTLPLALGQLQSRGDIRRVPEDGRLDHQRYAYVRWGLEIPKLSDDELALELARRFFRWAGRGHGGAVPVVVQPGRADVEGGRRCTSAASSNRWSSRPI